MADEIELVEYYENPVLTKSGQERIIAWHNTILKDDSGNIVGTLSSGQDITERKEAEERAEKHQAELLRVSRLSTVGEMASGLAHELNQPLTAILTGSGLCLHNAREGVKNVDRLIENLQLIETQAERAGKIIHHLRSLIKKHDAIKTTVNVNDTIREVADFMSSHIRHAEVELDLELPEQTPMVFADTIQIQQVLLNLMRNAIEAMEPVEPQTRRLTIRTSTSPDNKRIEVAIRDSGEGFACDNTEMLFDSFFSTKPNGLGIGLSLCRSIIEAHQGQLWAKPNPEGGSTFSFALPVAGDTL
jgi:C4-dicarboxylate-specific signal transduction histidine kinase